MAHLPTLLSHHPARPILIQLSLIFSKIAPLLYYGNRYEDHISGKTYRKFLPYGYSGRAKRKNVLCPGSLSLERHRLLWLYLKQRTDFFTTEHTEDTEHTEKAIKTLFCL